MVGVIGCAGVAGVSQRLFWRRETFTHSTTGVGLEALWVTEQDDFARSAAFLAQHGVRAGRWQQDRPASRSAARHVHAVTGALDVDSRPVTRGNPNTATSWPRMATLTAGIRMPGATMSIPEAGGRIVIGERCGGDRHFARIDVVRSRGRRAYCS